MPTRLMPSDEVLEDCTIGGDSFCKLGDWDIEVEEKKVTFLYIKIKVYA